MNLAGVAIGVVLLVIVIIWWVRPRGPRLGGSQKSFVLKQWNAVLQHQDPVRRILDADAVIARLLGELGFPGTMGDKLKKAGRYIPNVNGVWAAHKLRNRIAHEPGIVVSDAEVKRAMAAFEGMVRKYCS